MNAKGLDLDAKLHLSEFERVVLLGHVVDRVGPIGVGACAEADTETFDTKVDASGRPVLATQVVQHVDTGGGRGVAACRLRDCAEQGRVDPDHGMRAEADRRRLDRRHQAARSFDDFVDSALEPGVHADVRIVHGEVKPAHIFRHAIVHDEVDRPFGLVSATAEIEADLPVRLGKGNVHGLALIRHHVGVDIVAEAKRTVGHTAFDFGAQRLLRLREHKFESVFHRIGPEPIHRVFKPPLSKVAGRHEGFQVTPHHVGEARVACENAEHFLVQNALGHHFDRWDQDAFLKRAGRLRADAARDRTADIPEMPPGFCEGEKLVVMEDRRQEHHVGQMRNAAARAIGVVIDVEVAVGHRLTRIMLEHAFDKIAGQGQAGGDDELAVAVQERGEKILLFANERAHRGAVDQRFHLLAGRPQRAGDQLQRDGIGRRLAAHGLSPSSVRMKLPPSSISHRWPGRINVVVSNWSTTPGPAMTWPARSASRR